MLRCHTANLQPEQQRRLHEDFIANEEAYFCMRESLLPQYRGQWIAVHQGRVIAAGTHLLQVMDDTASIVGHPYIARAGEEESVVFHVRRSVFAYDDTYQPFALPQVTATFANETQTHSRTYDNVIPDIGADLCVLPETDCTDIDLFSSRYFSGLSGGVDGSLLPTLIDRGNVEIDDRTAAAFSYSLFQKVETASSDGTC
ncbi:MAG: hypothetical protein HY318_05460 [Armatimonadetes bacterium]|nr:hypothetical protein [Armatimonadota bacterium]